MKRLVLAGAMIAAAAVFAGPASADPWGLRRTCPHVWQQGPIVTADCFNAFGGVNRSSINASACPYGVGNANGVLQCNGGGYGGGGGYGYVPAPVPGPYGYRPHRPHGPNWD